jgi:hypothetical protein
MTRAQATKQLIAVAETLADNIRCVCHECWTKRGQHDPSGCSWEDIADLRAVVNIRRSTLSGKSK